MSENMEAPVSEGAVETNVTENVETTETMETPETSTEEMGEAIDEAVENGEISEEKAVELKEKFKIKVNGKEKEVELDWNNKEDIIRRLQMAEAGQMSMQKAREIEKEMSQLEEVLKNSPIDFLKEIGGHDVDTLMEEYLDQRVKEMEMSPEEKARMEMERELEELRRDKQEQQKRREEAEYREQLAQAEAQISDEITRALDSHTTLPKSPNIIRKMADHILTAESQGVSMSFDQAATLIQKEMHRNALDILESMEGDTLEKFLGENVNGKLKKLRAERSKKAKATKPNFKQGNKPVEKKKEEKKIKASDFFKNLGR